MNRKVFRVFHVGLLSVLVAGCRVNQPQSPETDTATNQQNQVTENVEQVPAWVIEKSTYKPAQTRVHDLLHTRLYVSFDWEKQHLLGEANLTFKPYFYPQNTVELDAKGFDVLYVGLMTNTGNKELKYTYNGRKLIINLDRTYSRTETFKILIDYTAKPNDLPKGGSEAITSDKGLYFINPLGEEIGKPRQIWTQGETEASSAWFPTIDAPNERMTQEIYITVDKKYTTLSNGTLVYSKQNGDGTKTELWKQDKPHAPYLAMMAIGEFAVVKDKWRNIDVNYYVEPAYKNTAKAVFGNTPEMLEFFSNKLGVVYPWDKYAQIVVRDYVSGAMENTSASLFMEALQLDSRELLDTNWDGIIAHELFHQWFGDLVTLESWANLPLNESFADYSEYLWSEHKYGANEAALVWQKGAEQYFAESQNKRVPLIRYHYKQREDMFDSHSYAKGGRVLHMLRKYVGDDAFFASLNLYLTKHKYQAVEAANLRMAFEEITGEDLNWFFNQWFFSPGHPELQIAHQYQNGRLRLQVNQIQDTVYSPVYKLPAKVSVWINDQRKDIPLTIAAASYDTVFAVSAAPQLILFDPDNEILAQVNHQKTASELHYQFAHTQNYLPKYEAIVKLSEKDLNADLLQVLRQALQDDFWKIRSLALTMLNAKNISNLPEDQKQKLLKDIELMAKEDKKGAVRADAILLLSETGLEQYKPVYIAGMKDSSYVVTAASMQAYASTGEADIAEKFKTFEHINNDDVIIALANYYAERHDPSKMDWYLKKIKTIKGGNQYFMLQNFGTYLMKIPENQKQQGIKVLAEEARNNPVFYLRLAAYQGLTLASETEETNELRKQIKENEKDERLKELYNMMP